MLEIYCVILNYEKAMIIVGLYRVLYCMKDIS